MASNAVASQGATTLNALVQKLPAPLQNYFDIATVQLYNGYIQLPPSARAYIDDAATKLNSRTGLATTTLLVLATAVAMSRWSRWGDRFTSPFERVDRSAPVLVTDDDFSYIPSTELEEPQRTYDPNTYRVPIGDDLEDDVLKLKNKGKVYPIKFPAFSIGDGKLYVKDLRDRAALTLGVKNRPIKLLYKGKQLKDDDKLCREYGLKDKSEVLCIIGEASDETEDESETGTANSKDSKKKKKSRKRFGKGKSKKKSGSADDQARDSGGPSRTESPAAGPLDKLKQIQSHFRTTLLPLCVQYTANPPTDPKKKDFEHKKLSETIMLQVLLKIDGVDTEGIEEARQFRKELVRETQTILDALDKAAGVNQ